LSHGKTLVRKRVASARIQLFCLPGCHTTKQTDRHTKRQTERETDWQTDKERDKETERQTGRQKDRQTKKQRNNNNFGLSSKYVPSRKWLRTDSAEERE
jgi:hypothetical protein